VQGYDNQPATMVLDRWIQSNQRAAEWHSKPQEPTDWAGINGKNKFRTKTETDN
jgi:hypothetical protein